MDKNPVMDDKAKQALSTEVQAIVEKCLSGSYETRDEAIEKLITDLEALKTPGEEKGMGGMGTAADGGMPLPAPDEGE